MALAIYALRKMGFQAMESAEGLPFDILAMHKGRPLRIQCKATQTCKDERYTFITARGRYATKNLHAAPLTNYTTHEIDLLACVALPIDRLLFVPVTSITSTKVTLLASMFAEADAAATSLAEALKELKFI